MNMKYVFTVSVIFFSLTLVVYGKNPIKENPATIPIMPKSKNPSVTWVAKGLKRLAEASTEGNLRKVKIVFIGDSITRHWTGKDGGKALWEKSFSKKALNFGMGGNRTEHVLYRLMSKSDGGLGHFDNKKLRPKIIVLMIGTNNLFRHDAKQIIGGVRAVVARLQELRPKSRIILCSILPAGNIKFNTEKIIPANQAIQSIEGVEWLDLYSSFIQEDGITKRGELYKDGLHLNAEGYKLWHDILLRKM